MHKFLMFVAFAVAAVTAVFATYMGMDNPTMNEGFIQVFGGIQYTVWVFCACLAFGGIAGVTLGGLDSTLGGWSVAGILLGFLLILLAIGTFVAPQWLYNHVDPLVSRTIYGGAGIAAAALLIAGGIKAHKMSGFD